MLSKEEISKYIYKEIEKLTYSEIAEWLINGCVDNQTYQLQIKKQEQIIDTQRRRIKKLIDKEQQDKISFCIEKLVNIQKYISDYSLEVEQEIYGSVINTYIDLSIMELKNKG